MPVSSRRSITLLLLSHTCRNKKKRDSVHDTFKAHTVEVKSIAALRAEGCLNSSISEIEVDTLPFALPLQHMPSI